MENEQIKLIIEGAILAAGRPLDLSELEQLFLESEKPSRQQLRELLDELSADCENRAYELKKTASGYRFQVRESLSGWVNRLWEEKPQKYSRAMLETLALIAYRQPVTRGDIEEIRGVAVSTQIIRTFMEREWVRVVGHRDVPGRPALYATTREFLDYFNLSSLEELPPLSEIRDIDSLGDDLALAVELEIAEEPESETHQDETPSNE